MAEVTLKSTPVTTLDAGTSKVNNQVMGGVVREAVGVITTNADDSIASIYRFARVPSRARITEVLGSQKVGSAASGIGNVGIYQTAANGGAVVDVDHFASLWDFNAAGDVMDVKLQNEAASAGNLVAEIEMPLWQALGLTSDPGVDYDVAITLTEAISVAACTLALKVRYVLPE